MTLLHLVDVFLVLGLTLRLIRLTITDDLGIWFVQEPVSRWTDRGPLLGWRSKIAAGADCPWCIGFWLGVAALTSLYLAGGPGHAAEWWRWTAAAFTLNWIAAHIGPRLGDAG